MLNKRIPTVVGILIIVLLAVGVLGSIFFFRDFDEDITVKDSEKSKEIAGWENYINEKYGFEIKYPYYLLDIDYNTESFKAFFPLESEDVFLEKVFSIEVKEEEYDKDTEYYCDQGIPHTSQVVLGKMNLCEVRSYEDVENNIAVRRFSYFLIHNKKWITSVLTLSYCIDKDCAFPSDLDIEKEKENFKQIVSTFKFLEEEIIEIEESIIDGLEDSEEKVEERRIGPKEFWLGIRDERDKIQSYAEFELFVFKYGSKESIKTAEEVRKEIDASPELFKDVIDEMAKSPISNKTITVEEDIRNGLAILSFKTTDFELKGTVTLLLENNQWKIDSEQWVYKRPVSAIKSGMNHVRLIAEIIYNDNFSYDNVCRNNKSFGDIKGLDIIQDEIGNNGGTIACFASGNDYCISASFPSGGYWCMIGTGLMGDATTPCASATSGCVGLIPESGF